MGKHHTSWHLCRLHLSIVPFVIVCLISACGALGLFLLTLQLMAALDWI